ncbi:MAG: hypothetical protein M3Z20_19220 [Chloroflexota bacterium]|nr:hypothetical protein [Chloroflexota bacterium]
MSTRLTMPRMFADHPMSRSLLLRWMPTFLGFPAGGALAMPILWALGWVVTTAAQVQVTQQFTNFGALAFTLLSGLLPGRLLRDAQPAPSIVHPVPAA